MKSTRLRLASCVCVAGLLGAAPASQPSVPQLQVGGEARTPMLVEGMISMSPGMAFGFHIATDGVRQLVVLYDAHDGTPLYISDGTKTLGYDLRSNRIVLLPDAYGLIYLTYEPTKKRAFALDFGVHPVGDNVDPKTAVFDLEQYVLDDTRLHLAATDASGSDWHGGDPQADRSTVLHLPKGDPTWLTFAIEKTSTQETMFRMKASLIGQKVPGERMTFPDITTLAKHIDVRRIPADGVENALAGMAASLRTKMGVTGSSASRQVVRKPMPDVNWPAVTARDRRLGQTYRDALKACGLSFQSRSAVPATRPTP